MSFVGNDVLVPASLLPHVSCHRCVLTYHSLYYARSSIPTGHCAGCCIALQTCYSRQQAMHSTGKALSLVFVCSGNVLIVWLVDE